MKNRILMIPILLILLFGVSALYSCKKASPKETETEDETSSELTPVPVTDATGTGEETTGDIFNTETETSQVPGTTPSAIPSEMELIKSGSAVSETGTRLVLRVEYKIYKEAGEETSAYFIETWVYIDCYSIFTGPRNNGVLTVNGVTVTFDSPAISISENTQNHILLASRIFAVENTGFDKITISASWMFNGTYAGVQIDRLGAEAAIDLK